MTDSVSKYNSLTAFVRPNDLSSADSNLGVYELFNPTVNFFHMADFGNLKHLLIKSRVQNANANTVVGPTDQLFYIMKFVVDLPGVISYIRPLNVQCHVTIANGDAPVPIDYYANIGAEGRGPVNIFFKLPTGTMEPRYLYDVAVSIWFLGDFTNPLRWTTTYFTSANNTITYRINGVGEPNATVRLYDGLTDLVQQTATVSFNGQFELVYTSDLTDMNFYMDQVAVTSQGNVITQKVFAGFGQKTVENLNVLLCVISNAYSLSYPSGIKHIVQGITIPYASIQAFYFDELITSSFKPTAEGTVVASAGGRFTVSFVPASNGSYTYALLLIKLTLAGSTDFVYLFYRIDFDTNVGTRLGTSLDLNKYDNTWINFNTTTLDLAAVTPTLTSNVVAGLTIPSQTVDAWYFNEGTRAFVRQTGSTTATALGQFTFTFTQSTTTYPTQYFVLRYNSLTKSNLFKLDTAGNLLSRYTITDTLGNTGPPPVAGDESPYVTVQFVKTTGSLFPGHSTYVFIQGTINTTYFTSVAAWYYDETLGKLVAATDYVVPSKFSPNYSLYYFPDPSYDTNFIYVEYSPSSGSKYTVLYKTNFPGTAASNYLIVPEPNSFSVAYYRPRSMSVLLFNYTPPLGSNSWYLKVETAFPNKIQAAWYYNKNTSALSLISDSFNSGGLLTTNGNFTLTYPVLGTELDSDMKYIVLQTVLSEYLIFQFQFSTRIGKYISSVPGGLFALPS